VTVAAADSVQRMDGRVSATRREAIDAGEAVLADGGNAVDAAVAACFVLGVVEPYMTGLGGVGELVHLDPSGRCSVVDAAARAPRSAPPDMYGPVGAAGGLYGWPQVAGQRNERGGAAATAPRLVAGLAAAHERWGALPWARLVEPAATLAERGWPVDFFTAAVLSEAMPTLAADPAARALYYPQGFPPVSGVDGVRVTTRNPDLAAVLHAVAERGAAAVGTGPVAESVVERARQDGAALTLEDLAEAAAPARVLDDVPPLVTYRGWRVHGSPLPSGAVTAARILAALDRSPAAAGPREPARYAAVAGASADAFAHRLAALSGDGPAETSAGPTTATTHLSVVDADGRSVALTSTLLSLFGAHAVPAGQGFCLNNGMMWFDPRPGRANSIAPGRRALSAVSPLVAVSPDGQRRLALGGLGARRIISAVAQVLECVVDHRLPLAEAVDVPRVHADPVDCHVDERLPAEVADALRARGLAPVQVHYGPTSLATARVNGVERTADGSFSRGIDRRSRDTWEYGAAGAR
jgi:gamma-glutamyltranspeptidase/glutathione hydrolase